MSSTLIQHKYQVIRSGPEKKQGKGGGKLGRIFAPKWRKHAKTDKDHKAKKVERTRFDWLEECTAS